MTDVALAAGVSLKTVSRVVNREPSVSEATVARVEQAIEELGFRRNEMARTLREGRVSWALGLITKDVSNPFYSAIARGVEDEVRERGLLVITSSSDEDPDREQTLIRLLCERRVAGLLVVPTGGDHSFLAAEVALGTPVVFIDRPPHRLAADVVLLDNVGGARSAVEHLLGHGHSRIGLVGDFANVFTTAARLRGYGMAIRAAGLPARPRARTHSSASAVTTAWAPSRRPASSSPSKSRQLRCSPATTGSLSASCEPSRASGGHLRS